MRTLRRKCIRRLSIIAVLLCAIAGVTWIPSSAVITEHSKHVVNISRSFDSHDEKRSVTETRSAPSDNKETADLLFRHKPLVIWSSNFHPTPVVDIKALLEPLGVRFIVKDLSSKYCEHFNTCSADQQPLRVINKDNLLAMTDYKRLIPEFYDAYRNDPEMQSVDAFLCCDPPGACELFEPFNKSMLIVATTRYNIGRSNVPRWTELNEKLIRIASRPWNVVGANNYYDQEYIRYFTGIDAQRLPSTCDYTGSSYNPTRPGFLLGLRPRDPQHFVSRFMRNFSNTCSQLGANVQLHPIRDLYAKFQYSDLASHRGIVHLPYQSSVMAVLEQYRMNIPMFFPSKELLLQWHRKWFVLHERSESPPPPVHYVRKPLRKSNIPAHWTQKDRPDPNNDRNDAAVSYWLQYADYYTLPHIIYFTSIRHLVELLNITTDEQLAAVSRKMAEHNFSSRKSVLDKWKTILRTVAKHSSNSPY